MDEARARIKAHATHAQRTRHVPILNTGTPGMLMSIALPYMCWLSVATPRLTLASHLHRRRAFL
jgi:hypothetical protein